MTLTATRIEITPTGSALGAIITGIDTSRSVAPEVVLQLKQAWRDHHLLIFKQQALKDDQLLAFAVTLAIFFNSLPTPAKVKQSHFCHPLY